MNMRLAGLVVLVCMAIEISGSISKHQIRVDGRSQCRYEENQNESTLNCTNQHLSYIPKINKSFQMLIFSYNDLVTVTAETFENITKPDDLTDIQLDHNKIHNISSSALDTFKNLKCLYLSNNPIYYYDLKHLLRAIGKLRFLKQLRMSGIPTITIQKDLFSLMKVNHIKQLEVNFYKMNSLDMEIFSTFYQLEGIRLEHNQLKILTLYRLRNLRSLYIRNNKIASLPNFSANKNGTECFYPNLEVLDLRVNYIRDVGKESLNCLRKLKRLLLGENPLEMLHNHTFSKLPVIEYLNLKYLTGYGFEIEPSAFKSRSLKRLLLGCNGLASLIFESFSNTFRFLPNLQTLEIAHTNMVDLSNQSLLQLFNPLRTLVYFACINCKLSQNPKYLLASMKRVQTVVLSNNLITTINDETFKENKHLRFLKLRYNQLRHVAESAFPKTLLDRLQRFDVSGNPFICDCSIEWFVNWLKKSHSKVKIKDYPKGYQCKGPTDKSNLLLSDVKFTYRECHPWNTWVWVAVIASPCVVVIATVMLIVYRNRWNIKHFIYLLRKKRNYLAIDGRDFVHNAFVAYEAEDSTWVRRRLLPILEEEMGLKLCIHERDFQPGVFINDNIVNHMEASEKIILIITNAFARSEWCMFELRVAHSKLIEESTEVVIIQLEKIDARNMNHSLKVLFNTTTYIEWTEDIAGQELFWTKLKDTVRK